MAAKWMAARDRGFTPAEQDAYLQWLSEDPIHGAEIARLSRAWDRLDSLHQWNPAHSVQPNADLLLPRQRRSRLRQGAMLAAAAALALVSGLVWFQAEPTTEEQPSVIMHPGPRRLTLADGSRIEMKEGAEVDVRFTPGQRAVHLLSGEAHFIVAKNPDRPFVVSAGDFTVRAVGTAFNVALAPKEVAVLVTEGQVQLGSSSGQAADRAFPLLTAGQQAKIDAEPGTAIAVAELTPAQVEAALAWQSLRLEFTAMPLRAVIAEFNRYNRRQLVIADDTTGEMVIGGTFRADNVEAFVRLLDVGFGVQSESDGEDIVLSRRL